MQPNDPMQPPLRKDDYGRYLCHATTRSGEPCKSPAIRGMRVCRMHGGGSPQAKRKAQMRLAELAAPAIATLAREMASADTSRDRQSAANSILDRAGYGRAATVEMTDARELLIQRLLELQDEEPGDDDTDDEPLD